MSARNKVCGAEQVEKVIHTGIKNVLMILTHYDRLYILQLHYTIFKETKQHTTLQNECSKDNDKVSFPAYYALPSAIFNQPLMQIQNPIYHTHGIEKHHSRICNTF